MKGQDAYVIARNSQKVHFFKIINKQAYHKSDITYGFDLGIPKNEKGFQNFLRFGSTKRKLIFDSENKVVILVD